MLARLPQTEYNETHRRAGERQHFVRIDAGLDGPRPDLFMVVNVDNFRFSDEHALRRTAFLDRRYSGRHGHKGGCLR